MDDVKIAVSIRKRREGEPDSQMVAMYNEDDYGILFPPVEEILSILRDSNSGQTHSNLKETGIGAPGA